MGRKHTAHNKHSSKHSKQQRNTQEAKNKLERAKRDQAEPPAVAKKKDEDAKKKDESNVAAKIIEDATTAPALPTSVATLKDKLDIKSNDVLKLTEAQVKLLAEQGIPQESVQDGCIKFLRGGDWDTSVAGPGTLFAVRNNEAYEDGRAMVEGERSYIRNAALSAEKVIMLRVPGKSPATILCNKSFVQLPGGTESLKERVKVISTASQANAAVKKAGDFKTNEAYCRVIARRDVFIAHQELLAQIGGEPRLHHTAKDIDDNPVMICQVWLNQAAVSSTLFAGFQGMIETYSNIVSSKNEKCQFTFRKPNATFDEMLSVATTLQRRGATTTFRNHGCIRVTMPEALDAEATKELKGEFCTTGGKIYVDTPVNVWTQARVVKPPTITIPEGTKLMRVQADYACHPKEFEEIAKILEGTIHQVRDNKFTPVSMSALIAVPLNKDMSEYDTHVIQLHDHGVWHVTPHTRERTPPPPAAEL